MEKPKYHCPSCNSDFDEPHERRSTYESEYGVSGMFGGGNTPCIVEVCPYCYYEDIEENIVFEDEESEEK